MTRNLIICSDGTGNTFSENVSNVTRLVKALELCAPDRQLVFYDQGLGTNPKLVQAVKDYKSEGGVNRAGLIVLPAPRASKLIPPVARVAGLAFGYGLRDNVAEMYKALAESYRDETDRVFLFGFSRGAFTVRVLAGLIYRCGLPPRELAHDRAAFDECFAEAYRVYEPHAEDCSRTEEFRKRYKVRDIEIQLLGIWDTVKSYGGIWPQSLPHLRHNPIVLRVRHALALNERRSWFVPTSWGGIDIDKPNAESVKPDARYAKQQVKELWFPGAHSDVGGGDREADTSIIPFRWMLREAQPLGIILTDAGRSELLVSDPPRSPQIHESLTWGWRLTEYFPRWELDNSRRPPKRLFKSWSTGRRHPDKFRRGKEPLLYQSSKHGPEASDQGN